MQNERLNVLPVDWHVIKTVRRSGLGVKIQCITALWHLATFCYPSQIRPEDSHTIFEIIPVLSQAYDRF